jgi:hypothetical protein
MIAPVLLAGVNRENAIRELIPPHSATFDAIAILGAIVLVTLVVFGWAVYSNSHHHRRHSHHHRSKPAPGVVSEEAHGKKTFWHPRRHDHRQREQLPRNPTLAETGGLPPVRHEKPPPPPA